MNFRKLFLIGMLVTALCMGIPAAQVLGGEPPPSNDSKIVGPTMWAVGVINCYTNEATFRIKKIEDCNVDTHSGILSLTVSPTSEADVLYFVFQSEDIWFDFGPDGCDPIITKVKNFKQEGDIVSFDAQIQFVCPQ